MPDRIEITDAPLATVELSEAVAVDWDHSRPLDVHKWSDAPNVDDAVAHIMVEAKTDLDAQTSNARIRADLRTHLKVIVLDLFIAWSDDPTLCLTYSRRRCSYGPGTRYRKIHLKCAPLMAVCDAIARHGYARQKLGFMDKNTGVSRQTRIIAKPKLMELILQCHIEREMVQRVIPEIRMRDRDKKEVQIMNCSTEKRLRPQVERINAMLELTETVLHVTRLEYLDIISRKGVPDTTRCSYSRVFNNSSFQQGGRFYSHWVQGLPREYRRCLTIEGQPVAELDYANLHPRMCYAKVGLLPPHGDVYDVPGFPKQNGYRPIVKTLLNCLINASSERKAVGALFNTSEIPSKTMNALRSVGMIRQDNTQDRKRAFQIVAAIKERHAAIADSFGSGQGVFLQHTDSRIAQRIMLNLWEQDIPSVCMHDSFVVPAIHAQKLVVEMKAAFWAEFKLDIPVSVEHCPDHQREDLKSLGALPFQSIPHICKPFSRDDGGISAKSFQ